MKDIKKEMCNCENCEGACNCAEGICNCENCSCKINEEVNNEEFKDVSGDIELGRIMMDKEKGVCYYTLPILENISPSEKQIALLQKSIDLFQQFILDVVLSEDEKLKLQVDYLSNQIEETKVKVEKARANIKQSNRVNEVIDNVDDLNE